MGRHPKRVPAPDGTDRREAGFYRTPAFLAGYVAERLLALRPRLRTVVDPCVGDGAFLAPLASAGRRLRGLDVTPRPLPPGIRFERRDFLEAYGEWRGDGARPGGDGAPWPEDAWVVNPPYNCHEVGYIRDRKPRLGALFPELGVHNLYALFAAAAVDLARPGALLALLLQDSFLTARAHAPLRELLLSRCALHELLLCPTDLFRDQGADVRSCLLLLEKGGRQGPVRLLDRPADTPAFQRALQRGEGARVPLSGLRLLGPADRGELLVGVPPQVLALFGEPRLGERYPTITGVSTGDDRRFLRPRPAPGHRVPFYKNPGRRKFWCPPDGYLPDDYLEVATREPGFQVRNRALLSEEGLVCSSMGVPFGACLRPPGTTFGVNANVVAGRARWWLLGYLNSGLVTFLVRGAIRRANMVTAGYVARIPLPALSSGTRRALGRLAEDAWDRRLPPEALPPVLAAIDGRVSAELGLDAATREHLQAFRRDLLRRS